MSTRTAVLAVGIIGAAITVASFVMAWLGAPWFVPAVVGPLIARRRVHRAGIGEGLT